MKQQHEKDLEELKTSLEEEYNNKLNKQAEEVDKVCHFYSDILLYYTLITD